MGPLSVITTPPTFTDVLPPSLKPAPSSLSCGALVPISATDTTGTTCSVKLPAAPTTCRFPVTASSGTRTSPSVPSTLARSGFSTRLDSVPFVSMIGKMISVDSVIPLPTSRIVCPGLAEATPAFAGVPESATDSIWALATKAASPPLVRIRIWLASAPGGSANDRPSLSKRSRPAPIWVPL